MRCAYPAIFHKSGGSWWVEFPDLPGCVTEGATEQEAMAMAGDALTSYLTVMRIRGLEFGPPSPVSSLRPKDGFAVVVAAEVP